MKRRHPLGYVVTVVLAVIGFAIGLIVHSLLAAAIAGVVILILGIAANEIWGSEVHQHHDHFPHLE